VAGKTVAGSTPAPSSSDPKIKNIGAKFVILY